MKKLVIALICSIFALSFLSPLVAAYAGYQDTDYGPDSWDSLSISTKYYAYYQAVKKVTYDNRQPTNIPTYEQYINDPYMQQKVNKIGSKYIGWNENDDFFVYGSKQGNYNQINVDQFVKEVEENGLANYGTGNYNGPANTANEQAKDNFYNNSSSQTSPDENNFNADPLYLRSGFFDLGNGYKLQGVTVLKVKYDNNTAWWQQRYDYVDVYTYNVNGSEYLSQTLTLGIHTTRFKEYTVYPYYYMSTQDIDGSTHYFINCTFNNDIEGAKTESYDITSFATYQNPNGDTTPNLKGIELWHPPYEPVDGTDQTGVNEELQKQNNDIISWLEKIYNAELAINSTIGSLINPLNNLTNIVSNLYSVCTSILNKLDNMTVKLKDWEGNEFKIELGDLELGDIAIDFDVVYNITGITKITTVNDVFKDMNNHKAAIESKLGVGNVKTSVNNFTTSLFGQAIFGQNGSVTSGTISESSTAPHLYFTFLGSTYDLFAGLSYVSSNDITTWKQIVTFFLYASTALCVFRSLPVLIGGVAGIENRASMVEHVQMEDNFSLALMNPHTGQLPDRITMYANGFKGRWM